MMVGFMVTASTTPPTVSLATWQPLMTWYCSTRAERRNTPTVRNQQTSSRWSMKGSSGKTREQDISLMALLASPIMSVAIEILLKQQQRRRVRRQARQLNTTPRLSQKYSLVVTAAMIRSALVRKMSSSCGPASHSLSYSVKE